MLENINYRKKNIGLGILTVLLILLVYAFGISNTIQVVGECSAAENKLNLAKNAPSMAMQLKQELAVIDSKLGNQNESGENNSENLLGLITTYCQENKVVLRAFPKTSIADKDDLLIETNQFILAGDFSSLLKLVYKLEQKNKLGKVASVNYQLIKDFKTRKMLLTATVFIQNIKKNK